MEKSNWYSRILKYFRTAPQVKSDKVLRIEKAGKMNLLIEAIESERKGKKSYTGIIVKRV